MDLLMYSADILNLTEIIRNRLYFAVVTPQVDINNTRDTFFFNIDKEFTYLNFYYDFGPLNISCLYKYCCKVHEYLQTSEYKRIVHYTSSDPQLKANAAYLIGCFAVIYLKVHPREMTKALVSGCIHFMPFSDASQGGSDWKITLVDCFTAIQKAFSFGFVHFHDFDVNDYDIYDKLQNGDINWLVPKKFLAFIGPTDLELLNYHPPEFYIQYFISNDVKAVIRLNNNTYDPSVFTAVGIDHYDLFFPDGSTPPKHILLQFLNISEKTQGAIAVHCKAGLGRTGSLIAAYIIKHYRFSAREAIAWLRICRPGSVIGQQQGWLEHMEGWLWRQGNYFRYQNYGDCDKIPKNKYGIYSVQWKKERYKQKKTAKEKELQSSTDINYIKNFETTANSSKVIPENIPLKAKLFDTHKTVKDLSQMDNLNKTQGDKLNMIKMRKQIATNSSYNPYVPDKISPGTVKTKNPIGLSFKKLDILNKKK